MQARAIFEAQIIVESETGKKLNAEIMIPLVSSPEELEILCNTIKKLADKIGA